MYIKFGDLEVKTNNKLDGKIVPIMGIVFIIVSFQVYSYKIKVLEIDLIKNIEENK